MTETKNPDGSETIIDTTPELEKESPIQGILKPVSENFQQLKIYPNGYINFAESVTLIIIAVILFGGAAACGVTSGISNREDRVGLAVGAAACGLAGACIIVYFILLKQGGVILFPKSETKENTDRLNEGLNTSIRYDELSKRLANIRGN